MFSGSRTHTSDRPRVRERDKRRVVHCCENVDGKRDVGVDSGEKEIHIAVSSQSEESASEPVT